MKKIFLFLLALSVQQSHAQRRAVTVHISRDTLILHKFAQPIGKEFIEIRSNGEEVRYSGDFKFTDRGRDVPLKATLLTGPDGIEPLSLLIKGSTSRFSTINDSIDIIGKKATIRQDDSLYSRTLAPLSFPVGGYSPGIVQNVLLKYWKKHNYPQKINLLPVGSVHIRRAGRDSFQLNGMPVVLDRYAISGLIWGNELVWMDKEQLVCLTTNDAEGDKVEMILQRYESLLPQFFGRAAEIGMQLFAQDAGPQATSKNETIAITGATLVDVTGKASIHNSVVLIDKGKITRIGRAGVLAIPAGARVIHAEGKTLLPGLWDMHAHFEQAEWGPAYLAAGVTTVRDCGNELAYINAIQQAIDNGRGMGPHILKAGIIDGPGPDGLGIVRASNKKEAVEAVQTYKNNGFVQIKIYSSIQPAVLKDICDEAHRLGLSVTGHIPEGMSLIAGIDSGMNAVNHVQYVYAQMKRRPDRSVDLQDSTNKAVLGFLRAHDIVVDPTLGVFELIFRSTKDDITSIEPNFRKLPEPLQVLFKNSGVPPDQAQKYVPLMQGLKAIVKAMHDEGIPIVAGTDMGFPGYSLHRELELYVDAGLTPLEAIQCATITPAQVMGRAGETGSIAEGKAADLVLIDGDPLKNIRDIRKVWLVVKDGQTYSPQKLHEIAGFLP